MHEEWGLTPITDGELEKVHLHLRNCSEYTIRGFLKAGHRILYPIQITRVLRKCACKGSVGRATPPKVDGWMGKFTGGILGIDVVYSLVGLRGWVTGRYYVDL